MRLRQMKNALHKHSIFHTRDTLKFYLHLTHVPMLHLSLRANALTCNCNVDYSISIFSFLRFFRSRSARLTTHHMTLAALSIAYVRTCVSTEHLACAHFLLAQL